MALRSSAKGNATSGSFTVTPAGVAAHDVLLAHFNTDSGTHTTPTGWTSLDATAYGPDGQNASLYGKADATGSDSFSFSSTSSFGEAVTVSAWTGRDNSTPFSVTPVRTSNNGNNSSPVSVSLTGITAAANDDLAVVIGSDQTDQTARWSFSTVSGYTLQQDGVNEDYCSGITLQTKENVSAGATGSLSSTATRTGGADGIGWCGWVVSIKAAAGGGSPGNIAWIVA